ncbi:hypothetical protein [Streptomyces radicis]|uniref:Uncharacterized protein n=1 Tax=Streptomyces radicis TaxID=1750517 RepID=A0A3A9W9E8_9ACTN|nr:hypothetical protein [Streptomyces radicis]RKN09768.1 hypothetical protein D7319_12040 [Streptomyces radicis]RKN23405.1 hypothetical protein D7318_12995 [Streptomyces radicis]
MPLTDDLRRTLSSSTPLYVAAGTADLAAQKLRELPATFDRLRAEAPERLPKLRERAQHAALQGVGIALEYAVRARETYDGLAERGKTVVERRRAEGAPADGTDVTVERAEQPPFTEPEARKPAQEPVTEPVTEPVAEEPAPKPRTARTAKKTAPRKGAPKKMPPKD